MIKIKVFGTLRLKTGCKGLEADASAVADVKGACSLLAETTGLPVKEFRKCVIAINGKQSKASAKLADGDEVAFFAPSGGG